MSKGRSTAAVLHSCIYVRSWRQIYII